MRTFALTSACLCLGLSAWATHASGQQGFNQPSLLPVPTYNSLSRLPPTNTQVAYRGFSGAANQSEETLPSPADRPAVPRGPATYPDPPTYGNPTPAAPMSGDFQQAASGGWEGTGSLGGGGCDGGVGCGGPCCKNPWYFYGGALIMGLANNNWVPLAYENSTGVDVLTTLSSPQLWSGGYEVIGGKYINCGCNAIEFRFWQLNPGRSQNDALGPTGNFNSRIFERGGLVYNGDIANGPHTVDFWGTNTTYQCLVHDFNFYSAEVDFLGGGFGCCNNNGCGCGLSRWGGNWLAGARYFHFDEYLRYDSKKTGQFTIGEPQELWLEMKTKNDLVGFQTGGQLTYQFFKGFTVLCGSRFGVYNNHITSWQSVHGGTGERALFVSGAAAGTPYDITAKRDALAFVGEIDLGVRTQITCNIAARFGYRAVGLSGVATVDQQIPRDLSCPCDASHINLGQAVLHGFYAGGEVCF